MTTTITCARCQRASEPMSEAPLPSPWGEELLAHACEDCFHDWMNTEIMIINEYKLDLGVPRNQDLLNQEMARFLNLPSSDGQQAAGAPAEATPKKKEGHDHGGGGGCC